MRQNIFIELGGIDMEVVIICKAKDLLKRLEELKNDDN